MREQHVPARLQDQVLQAVLRGVLGSVETIEAIGQVGSQDSPELEHMQALQRTAHVA